MWPKESPESPMDSSGYVSNSNSMNAPPVKYATVGRRAPGAVKRTSSMFVTQPHPPGTRPNPIPKPKRSFATKDTLKVYKNDLSRPSSRASKSSANSGSGLGGRRPASRERHGPPMMRRGGPRASHSKIRRPDSRASSKAKILRRQESKRRVRSATSGRSSSAAASGGSSRPTSRTSQGQGPSPSHKKSEPKQSFFSLLKPRLALKRSKSLHVKEKPDTRREIRFGDAEQPGVVMMRGVQHRRAGSPARPTPPDQRRPPLIKVQDYGKMDASMSQTLPRPPRHPDSHMRGIRASSVDIVESRERDRSVPPPAPLRGPPGSPQWRPASPQRAPPGSPQRQRPPGSPQRRSREREPERRKSPLRPSRSVSPAKQRPPSELSSSPAPRAPIWRASSDGSLSETITQLSAISVSRYPGRPAARPSKPRPRNSVPRPADKPAGDKPSVMDMIRRKFSMKPKEKASGPAPPGNGRRREGMPPSSTSPQNRLGQRERLRAARSHDMLADDKPYPPSQPDKKSFSSLPRGKHRSGGTTLTRKLSNMSWGTLGRAQAERQRNSLPPKDRGYPPPKGSRHDLSDPPYRPTDIEPPPPRSPERQRSSLREPPMESPDLDEEPMIQPIIQERRALSQPSLYFPANAEPENAEEPFKVYANLPFQLPARRSPSPTRPGLSAAKRAMSQPSLLDPPNQRPLSPVSSGEDRSDTIYAYSPHQMAPPPPGAQRQLTTRTVWKPTITVKRRGILKRRQSAEEKQAAARRVEGPGRQGAPPGQNPPQTKQQGMLHGIAHNIRSVFKHRKGAGNDDAVPEGYVAVPGGAVVSERFTNITNTHEQKDDVREEEEVHHLGDYTNEEVTRAIRDGADARALVRARQSSSDHAGQLVDPRNGQRRLIHQSGKTWRTVDTEDIHEKSHQDDKGELITETARTKQREEFSNVLVPDDGEELPESGVREAARSSSHHRRHTKDVDMLEYYSVPRGGRIGDGIKLGEGLRYVQENVEEDREGDDNIESLSERMRQLRQLGYKPEGQVLAKTPIEYQEEEKTKRQVTNKWLESHFAKGDSGSSEDGEPRRNRLGIENRRQGIDEVDHRRETNTYQYQKSSGTTQTGTAPPKTWSKSEKYSKNVRETPEHTYVTESRQGPRGGFDRVQVLPPPGSSGKATDLQSEVDEDPIFNSKFSTGKPRRSGGVRFQPEMPRWEESGRLSPPTQSPPPPPPPRHRKKGRDTQSPPDGANNNHYASSPIRERYQRELSPGQSREYHRQIEDSYHSSPSRQRRRDDYDDDRRDSQGRREERRTREFHFGSAERSSREAQQVSRGGGQLRREDGTSSDEQRRRLVSGGDQDRLVRHQQLESRHHRSVDHLDDRRLDGDRSRTLPRRPQQYPPSPVQRMPDASRFGGSMINVSSKQPRGVGPTAPQKPARSPIQRSNSMYDREGNGANEAFSVGLKSPDIISKMQRGTLRRGDGDSDRYRADERESQTSSSTPSYPRSPTGRPRPPPGSIPPSGGDNKKDSFMHGLKKAAPDLYNVLHGDGGKTPSPKQSPPMTPPPPLQRAQSPGQRISSGQRPGVRRVERLRGDDDDDGHSRSRSYTPPDETSYRPSPRPNVVKVQR